MDHHPSAVHAADPPIVGTLYTTKEVAQLLRVSPRTVQDWIRSGTLTAVRYGRLLRIRQADLATFGEVLTRRTPPLSADASPMPDPAGAAQA
jgi:excisionase family DNA binding protein